MVLGSSDLVVSSLRILSSHDCDDSPLEDLHMAGLLEGMFLHGCCLQVVILSDGENPIFDFDMHIKKISANVVIIFPIEL